MTKASVVQGMWEAGFEATADNVGVAGQHESGARVWASLVRKGWRLRNKMVNPTRSAWCRTKAEVTAFCEREKLPPPPSAASGPASVVRVVEPYFDGAEIFLLAPSDDGRRRA